MLEKIQKFGGAMFTPVLLFAIAGIVIGIGTLCTTDAIIGPLAAKGSTWYNVWNVILSGGWTVFNQLPLLFAVALPIGLAKKQNARCCMEVLVSYLTLNYFISTILSAWGPSLGVDFTAKIGKTSGLTMVAGIKTLDMGMVGALAIAGVVIYLHNRFFDTELPEWLGVFSGSTFVYMIAFFAMLPVAALACFTWPKVQFGMHLFQGFILSTGAFGVWLFVALERLLIPFGLHHLLYAPFYWDNVVVQGGIYATWAQQLPAMAVSTAPLRDLAPYAAYTATSWSKIFGCPGIALALYAVARRERKKELLALLIPVTLTAIICGITEPIEFTFLFIAPSLFVIHALLAATLSTVMYLCGVIGAFSGGLIQVTALNIIPLGANHAMTYVVALIVGLCFTGLYFIVFRFLILKFDFKTPGRESDDEQVGFKSRREYLNDRSTAGKTTADRSVDKNLRLAQNILDLLGGAKNIAEVSNCVTRLRVNVYDETLVGSDKDFKAIGTSGISKNGKAMQVIVGLKVPIIRERFESLL